MTIDRNLTFADIQARWTDLDAWGLRNRSDLNKDVPPWNLKYPPVSERIKRWDAFRSAWIGTAADDRKIEDLYQAAADVTVAEWAARHAMPNGFQADIVWHPINLPPITEEVDYSCDYNPLAHANVTQEAETSAATLRGRWKDLIDWGVRIKLPQHQDKINRWDLFTCEWNFGPSIGKLQGAAADLVLVEADARELGYKADRQEDPPVKVPSLQEGTYSAQASEKAKAALEPLSPPSIWASIPWYAKAGAAVIGVAIIANAVRR